jgi:hypothetical protein
MHEWRYRNKYPMGLPSQKDIEWFLNPDGYMASQKGSTSNSRKMLLQHRVVMEEHLGRKLLKGENVHHRNGVKHDNRIENLELWVTMQPTGQRPEDLLEWAQEIIKRYGK